MLCCTDSAAIHRSTPLRAALLFSTLLLWPGGSPAAPVKPGPVPEAGSPPASGMAVPATQATEDLDWAALAKDLGKQETRAETLKVLRTVQPFPAAAWVALLNHQDLAVRLGAMEVLEDLAGNDMGYDPWETVEAERAESLQRWRAWAVTGGGKGTSVGASQLQPEALQDYLQDILAGDPSKVERAVGKLRPYSGQVIGEIQRFLDAQKSLQEGARGRLKEAQYRLLLESGAMADSARLARLLVFGNRDERVEGLEGLAGAGKKLMPIVREMLADREALVRERCVDVIFQWAHKPSLEVVETHLKQEKDPNVIHAAIRGFGKIESPVSTRLLAGYLRHENEDLVASALLSISLQSGAAKASKAQIVACLKHSSWRVRAAALQCAAKANLGSLGDDAIKLLADSDSFVRQAAVLAVAAGSRGDYSSGYSGRSTPKKESTDGATQALCEAFERDDELKGVVLKAFSQMELPVPDRILNQFPNLPPELLAFGLSSINPNNVTLLIRYATDANPDVACSALRVLAKNKYDHEEVAKVFIQVLGGSDRTRQEAVLEHLGAPYKTKTAPRASLEKKLKEITADVVLPSPPQEAGAPKSTAAAPAAQDPVSRLHAAFLGAPQPNASASEPGGGTATPATPATPEGIIDRLHAAFLGTQAPAQSPPAAGDAPAAPTGATTGAAAATVKAGPPKNLQDALDQLAGTGEKPSGEDLDLPLMAALKMVESGHPAGAQHYLRWWPHLNVQHRAQLAEALSQNPQPGSLQLWQLLLRDPSREIRRKAVASAFYEEEVQSPIRLIFLELLRKDAVLTASDVYQSRLESIAVDRESRSMMAEQARMLVNDSRSDRQVLAAVMLSVKVKASDTELLERSVVSPYFWVRRAAVRSLGQDGKRTLEPHLPKLTKDPSAWVREAVAAAYADGSWPWHHHFDDNEAQEDEGGGYRSDSSASKRLSEPALAALRELARDKEDRVRLAAMSALLMSREEVHLPTYLELYDRASNRKELGQMMAEFVEKNYRRLGKGMAPLLDRLDWKSMEARNVEAIQAHFGLTGTETKSDFAAYAAGSASGNNKPMTSPAAQLLFVAGNDENSRNSPAMEADDADNRAKDPVTVLFFHNPGCHECEKVRKELQGLQGQFTGMQVVEHNIRQPDAVLLYEVLSQRFSVPPADRLKTPAVFLQSGALVTDAITYRDLVTSILEVLAAGETEVWHQTQTEELAQAKAGVEKRVQTLQPAVIFFAGLLDGVNPCAFATIIFLLSYLQVAKRTSREILMVGTAFILGVFLTYFVLGLGLVEVVSRLTALQVLGTIVNWILSLGCLVVAVLSWRDARLASQGRLKEMTLQLPGFLKDRIRGVIRTGTRVNRFVLAAFGAGVVISVLELACTGQVYLPTIVYAMNTGTANARGFLLLYNLAFIMPLIIVFGLAWGGMQSDALVRFQHRHTAKVKYALAVLFGVLFLVLAFR
ncbi:MAG: HEAT repeat domain-containing protein [Verrucomicrobium sp.]